MRTLMLRLTAFRAVICMTIFFSAAAVLAQQSPTLEKGFAPEKVFQFGDIDAINTFNGNLTLRIPIGPSYPVSGNASYGLTLTYNSKVWDFEEVSGQFTLAIPTRRSNAGMGWLLSLGRIITPQNSINTGLADVYESPDGNDHVFFGTLHDSDSPTAVAPPTAAVGYTRDGTYIRRLYRDYGTTDLEFPDGTIKTFDQTSGDLKFVRDRFGNGYDLTPLTSSANTPCNAAHFAAAWKITDTQLGRTNYVCFSSEYSYPDSTYPGLVERVVLAAPPAADNSAQTATYVFHYMPANVCRGFGSTLPHASRGVNDVPLLVSITQPDNTSFTFTYPPPDNVCGDAELAAVTLPTGATTSYGYRAYDIPVDKCNGTPSWNSESFGVGTRTVSGPRIPTATWTYASSLNTVDAFISCENNQQIPVFRRAPAEQMIVTVTDPLGNVDENYYSVWPVPDPELIYDLSGQIIKDANGNNIQGSPNGSRRAEYGFPITHLTNSAGRLLSQRIYPSAGSAPRRSFYRTYEHDAVDCNNDLSPIEAVICGSSNARVSQERTVYHDNNDAVSDADSSEFDGLGHYRTVSLGGTFATGNATTVTSFNKRDPDVNPAGGIDSGIYPGAFTMPTLANAWLLDIPGGVKRTENGVTAVTQTCFDSTTGFPRARRVLQGSSRATSDLLTIYTQELPLITGNVATEAFFGGDVRHNAPDNDLCTVADNPPTDFDYKLSYTYTEGIRTTSKYEGAAFLSLDRTVDTASGFVTSSRDVAGRATAYQYDASFRLHSVAPDGAASTTYFYSPASGSGTGFTPARVEVTTTSQTSNTSSGSPTSGTVERHYQYDSLGRLWREKTRMPDDTWSLREMLYNALGWKDSVSEQEKLVIPTAGTEFDFTPAHKTSYSGYDPFGRPGAVTLPDGHGTSFSYFGAQSMVRTTRIATATTGETDVPVTETYDRQGRLYQLTENSGPDGSAVVTTYGYHVTGSLSSVSSPPQSRTFGYDGRGLLLYERHPEKDGDVLYGTSETEPSYDARGHVTRRIDGPVDLKYSYDPAEHLRLVEDLVPGTTTRRTLKSFTYADTNDGSDLRKGRLVSATRVNHLADGRSVSVTETDTYGGIGGSVSKRDTAVSIDGVPFQTFSEGFDYDDLGERARLTYPVCLVPCGSANGPLGVLEHHYTNGALTSVGNYASLGYNANGTVGSVVHGNGNGVTDTIVPDDNAMPRPKSIQYSGFGVCGGVPSTPVISPTPASLCAGDSGSASVGGQAGATFTWTIDGGTITSNMGLNITYTATSSTAVLIHVSASNSCGTAPLVTASVPVTAGVNIQQHPQSQTIAAGGTAPLHVSATGTALTYQWYRGFSTDQTNPIAGANGPDFTTPTLNATTTYWVKVVGQCGFANSNSATITVSLAAPTGLRATTQQATPQGGSNTVVTLRWNAVSGASAYLVEWSSNVNGFFSPINPSNPTTVQLTATHVVSSTTLPAAFVYHVRSVDSAGNASSSASNVDYAVAGARLFANTNAQDEPLRKSLSLIRAQDLVELRLCIDALRVAANRPAVWTGTPAPTGFVAAAAFTSLQAPLNEALQAFGYGPFAYTGVPVPASCVTSPCVPILSEHVQQLRDTLRNALR